MSVETHVHRARECVVSERATLARKRDGLETFGSEIQTIETAQSGGGMAGTVTAPVSARATGTRVDGRDAVREAFAETVQPHAESDSTLAALRDELGEEVALALAPTTETSFTPALQQQLRSAVTARQAEIRVTRDALESERESLTAAIEVVEDVTGWLHSADETPLSELGFETLRDRHDRLDDFQRTCADRLDARQAHLSSTTSHAGQVGVSNRALAESLYEEFPVTHPVLSTVSRLLETCTDAQRAVRAHLVRRA